MFTEEHQKQCCKYQSFHLSTNSIFHNGLSRQIVVCTMCM
uniref:Uncharacterized protein n=1 Tax=Arundo donax TaxID=35708 RepID=A0A0A8ZL08_ARUDO